MYIILLDVFDNLELVTRRALFRDTQFPHGIALRRQELPSSISSGGYRGG